MASEHPISRQESKSKPRSTTPRPGQMATSSSPSSLKAGAAPIKDGPSDRRKATSHRCIRAKTSLESKQGAVRAEREVFDLDSGARRAAGTKPVAARHVPEHDVAVEQSPRQGSARRARRRRPTRMPPRRCRRSQPPPASQRPRVRPRPRARAGAASVCPLGLNSTSRPSKPFNRTTSRSPATMSTK